MGDGRWNRVRKGSYVVISLFIIFFILASLTPKSAVEASDLRNEIERLRNRLSEIESHMGQYEKDISALRSERDHVARELGETQTELQTVESELEEALVRLELTELEVEQARRDLQEAEDELCLREQLLNGRIRAMYELGTVSYLEVLLTAADFSDFVRRFQTLKNIIEQDVSILDGVKEQRNEVEERRDEWVAQKEEAQYWKDEVASKKNELEVQLARYEGQLSDLTTRQREYEAALDEMERRSEQIAADIIDKQKELALAEGSAHLQWPLQQGSYWISSPFGSRWHPILHQWRHHSGLDMAASTGTPIYASASGTVLDAGWMGGYGLCVIIAHTNSVSTLYAHASSLNVQAGQRVNSGDVIAYIGNTGFSTGPHLHYEVRINGTPENPLDHLPGR